MGKNLSRVRRILLALCGLVLAAALPAAAAALPAESVLFQPAPLLSALDTNGLYRDYPRLMLAFSAAGGDLLAPGLGSWAAQNLAQSGAEEAIRFIFPPEWLRLQTAELAAEFYGYANFKQNSLDLAVELLPVKQRLTGGEGRELIANTLSAWPACTLEDSLVAAALLLQGRSAELPRCSPPPELMPAYLQMLQLGLDTVAAGLPDRAQILPVRDTPAGGLYAVLRWALRLSPLALLLLPACAAAVLRGSARALCGRTRALLAWAGPPLYTGGLLAVLTAGLIGGLTAWLLPLPIPALPPPVKELYLFGGGVFLAVWREFLLAWAVAGSALAASGMAFIFINSILEHNDKGDR